MKRATTLLMAAAAAIAVPAAPLPAEIKTETVEYHDGKAVLEGYLAYDDAIKGRRPGVVVFHEWWGLNDYAKKRARQLAALGYVALAADVYGKGVRATNRVGAGKLAGKYKADRKLMRSRARAALNVLAAHRLADRKKLAAIGYCFGGTVALELARSGADLRAVVSFHGGLSTPAPRDARRIRAKVLVLHGGDNPHVPAAEVLAFQKEMRKGKVDWQMNVYGGAVHAFTNPASGKDPAKGAAYDERAARRSWSAMQLLFAETIGLPKPDAPGGIGRTIGRFARDKIAKPIGAAGKATGRAAKRAAGWIKDKVTGGDE